MTGAVTRLSSREFDQDTGRARRAAKRGPVFITDRGRPAHVLMTIEEYERLVGGKQSIIDTLGEPPLIGATALVHQPVVVTRDVADFGPTGGNVLDPWQ